MVRQPFPFNQNFRLFTSHFYDRHDATLEFEFTPILSICVVPSYQANQVFKDGMPSTVLWKQNLADPKLPPGPINLILTWDEATADYVILPASKEVAASGIELRSA